MSIGINDEPLVVCVFWLSGGSIGKGEAIGGYTLVFVIDGERRLDDIFYSDINFSGVRATESGSSDECDGIVSFIGI